MKKTLIFILMILVLMVSSCNLFLKEEYGELILSFDGSLPDGADRKSTRRTQSQIEEHTSELQSQIHLVCRLLLEKKNRPAV